MIKILIKGILFCMVDLEKKKKKKKHIIKIGAEGDGNCAFHASGSMVGRCSK
jgi:hypothetical protein